MQGNGQYRIKGQELVRLGKFREGFGLIEQEPGFFRSDEFYNLPKEKRLTPGTPIAGKTVLLALEGGFGDEVAWGRYAQHAQAAGARVLVGTLPGSAGSLRTLRGAHTVKRFDFIGPDEYDYYLLGMSAPAYFGVNSPSDGATIPYIEAPAEHTARVRPLIHTIANGKTKIGVHWQGNKEYEHLEQKSFPARLLLPFAELGQLFSLQRDAGHNTLPPGAPVVDTQQGPADWEHTLAVIAEMDYIITGCTSIAHYAGALGKPVLLIINHSPSYYWADATQTTPWYPTVRVFRQERPGDWESALTAARAFLHQQLQQPAPASTPRQQKIIVSAVGGLGDHATAEPIIRYLIAHSPGADIRIAAHWPRVFEHLGVPVYPHNTVDAQGYTHLWTLPGPDTPLMQAANFLLCHMADYQALALLRRQIPLADREIRLAVSPAERLGLAHKLGGRDPRTMVVVHAGKSWRTKTFPLVWWQAVVDTLAQAGVPLILVGKSVSHLQGDTTGVVPVVCPPEVLDLRDTLSVGEFFALLEQAPILLSNDSAPVQIAGAFDNWIVMLATIKPPELVFPIRQGSTAYKTKALYKKLLADDIPFTPTSAAMSVDFAVDDWSVYLPAPAEVAAEVAGLYRSQSSW